MQDVVGAHEGAMSREENAPLQRERSPAEERDLLLKHREGDPEAFPRLVARYRAPVYSYLIRCGVPDADRDDLFQDIFIKIHQASRQYQDHRPLHPWLFTIVANTVRSYYRRRRVRQILFTDIPPREPEDCAPDGEQIAQAKQTAEWLQDEIHVLPVMQRQVLVLACIENLAQKEIAEALRMPVSTVKTHLRRARLTLVRKLARRNAAAKETTP